MSRFPDLSARAVKAEPAPSKQADRLLDMLDDTASSISRNASRISEAVVRLAGPGGPVALAAVNVPTSGHPGTLGRIDDKLTELRAHADELERLADRLETIA